MFILTNFTYKFGGRSKEGRPWGYLTGTRNDGMVVKKTTRVKKWLRRVDNGYIVAKTESRSLYVLVGLKVPPAMTA